MMVANRLKNLAQVTRGAVRDVRRALEDLLDGLNLQPKPQLVRVPVRADNGIRSPFNRGGPRSFSTSRVFKAYATNNANFGAFRNRGFFKFIRSKPNLTLRLWPSSTYNSALRTPFQRFAFAKAPLRGTLYNSFVNLSARSFTTVHGGSYGQDGILNLFIGFQTLIDDQRTALQLSKMNKAISMNRESSHVRSFHGCASQSAACETLQLARSESTHVAKLGAYVEFKFPKVELSIPSVAFMNSEIMGSIEEEFQLIKKQIDTANHNIKLIFENYGSLPIERIGSSVRIHFPNLEAEELERLLIDLNIDDGLVFTMDELDVTMEANTAGSELSSSSLSDLIEDCVPGLVSSESGSEVSSMCDSAEFFPVLSSSDSQYLTPIDPSEASSPVIIAADDDFTFSQVSA
ncbi:Spg5p CYBJADRAFT_160614 [Cyberlindnera jadinii NRRL Y-1542]|uniref:Stationary phase protein 5 n=2 Tax=Cyberlindnera jadinii (strain ATCC 18201 / CBS 1600 / BCRC 20928 / JCM 3617 / NBRC 0987 / NRRL Y-1542) TaxID=983966 RepID=A0A1E4S6N5_CYBJN|nr:hypothetical protein CYBJADRAFT_160614 [Cyberlindnera jadinii NRRL Y-1542]ODV75166.1 hypothetical protein CYBJADRAFT_160614 [Cyberlindnera jadinii NRRL Y-1542]